MANYSLTAPDGSQVTGEIDDAFKTMDPQHQQAVMGQILDGYMRKRSGDPTVTNPGPAAPKPAGDTSDSYSNALRSGASSALQGVGQGMTQLGNSLPEGSVADFLKNNASTVSGAVAPPAAGYVPPSDTMAKAFNEGRYGDMVNPGQLGRLALSAAPQVAATVGAGAVGGPIGAAAASAAMNAGPNIAAFAKNNGEDPDRPGLGSALKGAALTIPTAALDAVGAGAVGASQIAKLPTAALRAAARTTIEGGTQAANAALQEGATTGEIDPGKVATAALGGAAARGAGEGVHLAGVGVRAGAQGLTDQVMSRTIDQPATKAIADSYQRVSSELNGLSDRSPDGSKATKLQQINQLHTDTVTAAQQIARNWKDLGAISDAQYREIVSPALNNAKVAKSTITDDPTTSFGRFDELTRVPADQLEQFKSVVQDIDTTSVMKFHKHQTGPLASLGGALGGVASVIGAGVATGPIGAGAALLGAGLENKIGRKIGSVGDRILGTNKPLVDWQAQAAKRNFGAYDGPGLSDNLQNLRTQSSDPQSSLMHALNLDPASLQASSDALTAHNQMLGKNGIMQDALADNRAFDKDAAGQARPLTPAEQRAYDIQDAGAVDRQRNAERSGQIQDATAVGQQMNAERGRQVQDATAVDRQRTATLKAGDQAGVSLQKAQLSALAKAQALTERSQNFTERAADQVSGMAYRSPEARAARREGQIGATAALSGLDEVGNPRTKVPVNTPLKGDSMKPITQTSQGVSQTVASANNTMAGLKRGAQETTNKGLAGQPAPVNFQDQAHPTGGFGQGPSAYAQITANQHLATAGHRGVSSHDIAEATHSAAHQGLFDDHMKASGIKPNTTNRTAFADAVNGAGSTGHPAVAQIAQVVAKEAIKNKVGTAAATAMLSQAPKGSVNAAGLPVRQPDVDGKGSPIRSRAAYDAGAKANIDRTRAAVTEARSQGHTKTAELIEKIGPMPRLERLAEVQKFLAGLAASRLPAAKAERAYASKLLNPSSPLMKARS